MTHSLRVGDPAGPLIEMFGGGTRSPRSIRKRTMQVVTKQEKRVVLPRESRSVCVCCVCVCVCACACVCVCATRIFCIAIVLNGIPAT